MSIYKVIDIQLDSILWTFVSEMDKGRPVSEHQTILLEVIEGLKKLKTALPK